MLPILAIKIGGFRAALYKRVMPKPKPNIEELIIDANTRTDGQEPVEVEPEVDVTNAATPTPATPSGLLRIRILTDDHTDGKYKKTWKKNSVIEIDEYTAQRMINAGWAAPTTAALNEMTLEYKGGK
jgi:hypothetical protein